MVSTFSMHEHGIKSIGDFSRSGSWQMFCNISNGTTIVI